MGTLYELAGLVETVTDEGRPLVQEGRCQCGRAVEAVRVSGRAAGKENGWFVLISLPWDFKPNIGSPL